jgi:perosamine synthetase
MRINVLDVLDTGRISYGPYSKRFEEEFSAMHGCKFGVLSNSGTSSLHVALAAMKEMYGWADGDEVIVPALTFVATVNIVLHCKMTPVLVDVERDYYGIDCSLIKGLITSRTRAIIPVHTFGQPCHMSYIHSIADNYHLKLIWDSCECMGVQSEGLTIGAWRDVSVFSMYVAHLLTTGVGGIATTNDPELAIKMRSLVNHGRDNIYLSIDDARDRTSEVIGRRFKFPSIGFSYRVTELEAALGVAQLDTLKQSIYKRQCNASWLTERLNKYRGQIQLPSIRPNTSSAFMMYPIVMLKESKQAICEYLEAHGIETRECLPLTNQPCYKGMFNEDDYPVAKWMNRNAFYVATHPSLTGNDLDYMADTIGAYLDH